jgi:GAF domain-containing protein
LLQTFADQAVIAIENTRLFNETKEALERQTATADILKVIASSPSDVQPVFDAIAHSANRLIGGFSAAVFRYIDDKIHLAAFTPTDPEGDAFIQSSFPVPLEKFPPYQLTRAGAPAELPDTELEPAARDIARARGYRSMLFAPLMNDGEPVGIITVTRVAPGPFGEQHTRLLQMFADQAVIAIKNVGLFNEVKEALERQTATSDILKVIASSPSDVRPVFDVIVERAVQLCGARIGRVYRYDGELIHMVGGHGLSVPGREGAQRPFPRPASDDTIVGRVMLSRKPNILADLNEDDSVPPLSRQMITAIGARSQVTMPMLLAGQPIGAITLSWAEPHGYTEQQVELLRTFADQAVIAIENARLFNEVQARTEELSESLRQQTTTADVLKVISRSAFDLETVLDTLTASAAGLCDADMAAVTRPHPDGGYHHATRYNFPPEWDRFSQTTRVYPDRGSLVGRVLLEGRTVQIPDVLADPEYAFPEQQRAGGYRTLLGVPLLREGQTTGVLFLGRTRVESFSEKQIELVQTFADQAVIAIENVRLFDEVQARTRDLEEALTYQTGSANILRVIASSPTDVQPVLTAIVENACEVCDANDAIVFLEDGGELRSAAHHGPIPEGIVTLPITPTRIVGRAFIDQKPVHVRDFHSEEGAEFPDGQEIALRLGHRTMLAVPLLRDGLGVGVIALRRNEVQPFTDEQIRLLQTFADQAVIAIGNVRLFEEVQAKTRDLTEALTYQTGSSNILRVIASSPTDVKPVLKAIVESACELCDAYDALLRLKNGDHLDFSAHHGPIPVDEDSLPINRNWTGGVAVLDQKPVHIHDLLSSEGDPFPGARERARRYGHRAILTVPLLREGESIGAIMLRRNEVMPFTDKQIALLQTFADQAVIAIGNVRLFEEVQARTRDLTESLQQQTATADLLKVIASSPTDVEPVLQAIVESACAFCNAYDAGVLLKIGNDLHFSAHHGPIRRGGEPRPINRDWVVGRSVIDKIPVQVSDFWALEPAEFPEGQRQSREQGHRCTLSVPLVREGEAIGAIALRRLEPVAFSEKQVALLQTFADQAVIAIGNVRLFEEVQARTRELTDSLQQQTATSEVLQVISSSPGDLAPVFEKMLVNATRVCGAKFGSMLLAENGSMRPAAQYNVPAEFAAARGVRVFTPHPKSALAKAISTKQVVHVADMRTTEAYLERAPASIELVELGGARTVAIVPMLRDDEVIGAITVYRDEVQLFSDKQIELLSNFAKQAVIAIENARLLSELRQRTSDLSKSLDDLRTAQDRLVQTEKLASLGQLTAGIAHEIKNPLNFVNNFAALSAELTEELNDALKPAELAEKLRTEVDELTGLLKSNLEKVVQHGKRADSIVRNMLLHSREGGGEHRPSDINALIDESLNLAYHGARAERPDFNVTLERDFDPAAGEIDLFPQEITRVILNMVANGFHAVTKRRKEGGETGFEPTLRASTKNLGDTVEIRIRDNGTGITVEVKDKMFNPFFTTKPAGEGTGLGLSMSHDIIVKQHGGTIDVDTEQGHFTEFRIVLPRTSNFANKSRG